MHSTDDVQPDRSAPPFLPPPVMTFWQKLRSGWHILATNRIFPLATFLCGLLLGIISVLFYAVLISHDAVPRPTTGMSTGAFVVQISPRYIAELAQRNLQAAGVPGTVQDVQASMTQNGPLIITGEERFSVLGVSITRRFTILLQPYVQDCQLQVHILHVDWNGITVTGLAASFERQINRDLRVNISQLPQGFAYCTSGVKTEPQALSIIYAAVPLASPTVTTP